MKPQANIIIFRKDLRIIDNLALCQGANDSIPALCIYLHDTTNPRIPNRRGKYYLHHSIISLQKDLKLKYNVNLQMFSGTIIELINKISAVVSIIGIYYNRIYEPWALQQDGEVRQYFPEYNFNIYNSHLLIEPEEILTISQTPFKVFSRFYDLLKAKEVRDGLKPPEKIIPIDIALDTKLENLKLIDANDKYDDMQDYKAGENEAVKRLDDFLEQQAGGYHTNRDIPSVDGTSRLSCHINFGEISMVYIWHVASMSMSNTGNIQRFLTEIAWRTFASYVLYHNPSMIESSVRPHFDLYNWSEDEEELLKWKKGKTGFPIVDAGMRQLNQTGYMHNRVRMIVASYLVKHLLQPWQMGEAYFYEQLIDYDLASNCMNWQWSACSGIDAAPFFRIFSPQRQGERFDSEGEYVKYWIPELSNIPNELIHEPWHASKNVLVKAGVELEKDYPERILAHDIARKRALSAYRKIRSLKTLINT